MAKRKAARRRLLNSDLIILETTGAKTDNDTHVAKKSLCKVSPLAQRPCKFHNTRTGTENCRDVDCRLGRDRTHSSRRSPFRASRRELTQVNQLEANWAPLFPALRHAQPWRVATSAASLPPVAVPRSPAKISLLHTIPSSKISDHIGVPSGHRLDVRLGSFASF